MQQIKKLERLTGANQVSTIFLGHRPFKCGPLQTGIPFILSFLVLLLCARIYRFSQHHARGVGDGHYTGVGSSCLDLAACMTKSILSGRAPIVKKNNESRSIPLLPQIFLKELLLIVLTAVLPSQHLQALNT